MTDHPEFPQESPAVRYIVDQVSKIEDAQACSTGYYRSLGKVLARLDKTDMALVQLKQITKDLSEVTDSNAFATVIGKKSDEINNTLQTGILLLIERMLNLTDCRLKKIQSENRAVGDDFVRLVAEIRATNEKLDSQISTVSGCLVIPAWQAWLYALGLVLGGVLVGWFL